jgi:hypothetical protein
MSVHWLLDPSVFESEHTDLSAAIERQGFSYRDVNRPALPYDWQDTKLAYRKLFPRGACVVTHADIDLVMRVRADGDWTPGVFASVERFFCSHYFAHFGRFLLNRDYTLLPFAELLRCADLLFETFGRDGLIFVRPDSPLKLFTGLVASQATFERDVEFMGFYDFPRESLVVVSSPKPIRREWRLVIADGQIVAGSQYKEADQNVHRPGVEPEVEAFGQGVLSVSYAPDPVWVMDICQTEDSQCHLLEIGGFSFASLYACDKNAVVRAVSAVAQRIHAEGRLAVQLPR